MWSLIKPEREWKGFVNTNKKKKSFENLEHPDHNLRDTTQEVGLTNIFSTSTLTQNTVKCFKQPCDSALLNKRLPLCKMKFLATSREGSQTVTQQKSSGRGIHEFQEMFHIETCAMHGLIHT